MSSTAVPQSFEVLDRAKVYGADLAGIVSAADLQRAMFSLSSHAAGDNQGDKGYEQLRTSVEDSNPDTIYAVNYSTQIGSLLVIAVHHPQEQPEMDWWYGAKDPPGNTILRGIINEMQSWLGGYGVATVHLPYQLEKGGVCMKDAAVLAGLGVIGKNNLVITPQYGPRIRLRCLAVASKYPTTTAENFDPCRGCTVPCRQACPQGAFVNGDHGEEKSTSLVPLQATDGCYSRLRCSIQMKKDERIRQKNKLEDSGSKIIKYCRLCELQCVAGRKRYDISS